MFVIYIFNNNNTEKIFPAIKESAYTSDHKDRGYMNDS